MFQLSLKIISGKRLLWKAKISFFIHLENLYKKLTEMTSEIFLAFFKFGSSNANTIFRNWKMNSHFTTKMKISSQLTISKNLSMCEVNHYPPVTEIKLYKLIQRLILYSNKIQHNVKDPTFLLKNRPCKKIEVNLELIKLIHLFGIFITTKMSKNLTVKIWYGFTKADTCCSLCFIFSWVVRHNF